jgi:hypothetical protein
MKIVSYSDIREKIQPGDIIAFSGRGWWSRLIKWWTKSTVSHIGIVEAVISEQKGNWINQLIESTTLDGFAGVCINRLSARIEQYRGDIWWLPLSDASRAVLSLDRFGDFLLRQRGKKYDKFGAIRAGVDFLDRFPLLRNLTRSEESFSRLYCSELAAAGLEAGGVLKQVNASEITPDDLCRFKIFGTEYVQLSGKKPRKIIGYNTRQLYT